MAITIKHGGNHPEFDQLAQIYYDEWELLGTNCGKRERFYKKFIKNELMGWIFLDKDEKIIDFTKGYKDIKKRIKTRFASIQRKNRNRKSRGVTS
jgi:hypothetical protein